MISYSVKIVKEDSIYGLELQINAWLYKNENIKIINISHSTYVTGYATYHTAIILYKKE